MTGAKSGAKVALPPFPVRVCTSRKREDKDMHLFLDVVLPHRKTSSVSRSWVEGLVKTARDEAMSLLDLVPKEQRPRSCAVITVVCVLIAVGIGVGLYFAVFSGRGADTGAKGEAASTVGS